RGPSDPLSNDQPGGAQLCRGATAGKSDPALPGRTKLPEAGVCDADPGGAALDAGADDRAPARAVGATTARTGSESAVGPGPAAWEGRCLSEGTCAHFYRSVRT